MNRITGSIGALLAAATSMAAATVQAQSAAEFYGKNEITMVIGYNPGGTYDLYARLVAKHLGKHIPGNPNIIPKNVPGVGGIKAANFLYKQAARDGATIGVLSQNVALQQVLEHRAVRYDARKFDWLGRMATAVESTIVWHTAPVKTLADARKTQIVLAATSRNASTDTNPRLMNLYAGTKFKIALGYKGTNGSLLAMERGEVQGAPVVVQTLLTKKAYWLKEKKVRMLVQYSQKRHKAFSDVPAMVEFGDTPEEKEVLKLYGSTAEVGRAVMAPPGLPRDRLATLQKAFTAMVGDPEVIAEMSKRKLELDPLTGAELKALIDQTFTVSAGALKRAMDARK